MLGGFIAANFCAFPAVFISIAAGVAVDGFFYVLKDPLAAKVIYVILTVIVVWFVCYTNIITEKKPPNLKDIKNKIEAMSIIKAVFQNSNPYKPFFLIFNNTKNDIGHQMKKSLEKNISQLF